jgi:hypothetical protein
MIFRSLLAAAALLFAVPSAHAAFDFGDLICESSTTTGTGTLNLAGALTNYVGFASQITSASVVPYHIIASDGKLEAGYGVYTDAGTDTLTRVANWSTDGSGAELTLPAGTHSVCVGPNTQMYNGFKGMQFYNNDAGAVGAVLPLWHDSASAADGDIAGEVQVWGGADDEEIGQIRMEVDDGATTSEDTQWQFVNRVAGADLTTLTLGGVTPNGIYGNNMLLNGTDYAGVAIQNTATGVGGPVLELYHNSSSPTTGDYVGQLQFSGEDDASNYTTYGYIGNVIVDESATLEDSKLELAVLSAGASLTALTLGSSSDPTAIFTEFNLDAALNGGNPGLGIVSAAEGAGAPVLRLEHTTTTPAAGDNAGYIDFFTTDSGAADQKFAGLTADTSVVTAGAEYGILSLQVAVNAADTASLQLGNTGFIRFYEASANGAEYKAFITAAANTATTTCTFENDANFVPDSCVGDGSDASDGRIKTDLKPAGDVGTLLDSIKIYDYAWTVDALEASESVQKGRRGFGPVAQELFNVNADFVEVGGDDPVKDPWTWKPEKVVPYLIVEVQNLRKRLANSACYGIKLGSACIGVSM